MGIGGSIVILMASMVANIPQQIVTSIQRLHVGLDFILLLVVMGVIFLYVSVTFQEARYRIPVNKIDIHNRFKQYSYLDIMLTPAGGMPFMYAISMVSIPQYVLLLLRMVLPKADWIPKWISALTIGQPLWLVLYQLILFVLSIAFCLCKMSVVNKSRSGCGSPANISMVFILVPILVDS